MDIKFYNGFSDIYQNNHVFSSWPFKVTKCLTELTILTVLNRTTFDHGILLFDCALEYAMPISYIFFSQIILPYNFPFMKCLFVCQILGSGLCWLSGG